MLLVNAYKTEQGTVIALATVSDAWYCLSTGMIMENEKKVVISQNRFELMLQAILAANENEQEKFSHFMDELIDLKCKIIDADTFRTNSP